MGVKSVLARWIGQRIGLMDQDFWRQFFGAETWAGEPVNVETALQVAAFWSCVRIISSTIGTLPLQLYRREPDGGRTPAADHWLYALLHDAPNPDQTAVEFWEGMAASLCCAGNAFAEKKELNGRVTSLTPLPFETTRVERDPITNVRRYRVISRRGRERVLTEEQVLHVRAFGFGGDLGLSPIAFARQTISAQRAVERASSTIFANGMRPSGWLLYKGGTLTPEQRKQARENIIDPMSGAANAGKTGILEADFDYKQVTIPPEDAQMLETRQFGVEEVCRWLGVPPILVGHASAGQTMWGSGVEQIMLGWLTLGLRPYLTRLEQSIRRSLLPPVDRATLYSEFNVEGLLRADSAGRAALYSVFAQNGIMTRNEIRAKENLSAKPGGDDLTIQVNLQTLEAAAAGGGAQAAEAAQLKAALRRFLEDPDSNVVQLPTAGHRAAAAA